MDLTDSDRAAIEAISREYEVEPSIGMGPRGVYSAGAIAAAYEAGKRAGWKEGYDAANKEWERNLRTPFSGGN